MLKKFSTRKIGLWISIASLIAGFIGLGIFSYKTYAATVNAGVLQIEYDGTGALFNDLNIAPGFTITKIVKVTNTGTVPHSFSIAVDKVLGPLADVVHIKTGYDGIEVWDKTISEIVKYTNSEPIIGSLAPGSSKNVEFTAYLPGDVGNDYMGESTFAFDFVVGNESTDMPEPSGNPSPPPGINFGQRVLSAITYKPPAAGTTGDQGVTGQPGTTSTGGAVAGTETGTKGAATVARSLCFWWLVMLVILIIALILYHRYIKEEKPVFWWIWPIVIAVILFFVQFYFDKFYQPTIFCHYFWAIEAGVLLIYFVLEIRALNKPAKK